MIHNIPQPALEQELMKLIAEDPNVTLFRGCSIHSIEQVHAFPMAENTHFTKTNRLTIIIFSD
jgi:2-polyprenyl-6-methoxyphenol hydroxylase-like FAD-dependent oxidoreductase